jgi:hypothetical protein
MPPVLLWNASALVNRTHSISPCAGTRPAARSTCSDRQTDSPCRRVSCAPITPERSTIATVGQKPR